MYDSTAVDQILFLFLLVCCYSLDLVCFSHYRFFSSFESVSLSIFKSKVHFLNIIVWNDMMNFKNICYCVFA